MGIKTSELLALHGAIVLLVSENTMAKPKFGYALSVNRKRTVPFIEAFEDARSGLIQEYARRNEDGEMVTLGEGADTRVDLTDPEAFRAAEKALLDEEVDFSPHCVSVAHLPDSLSLVIINGLMPMLTPDEGGPATAA